MLLLSTRTVTALDTVSLTEVLTVVLLKLMSLLWVSKVSQYLKLSHYAPKHSHYAQLCSHLFGYHYAQNYAIIIYQGPVVK